MFEQKNNRKNAYMLHGALREKGYDWWWHSFTAHNPITGESKPFFIEFFLCNPGLAEEQPVYGQLSQNQKQGKKPSYLMVKAGCWGPDARQIHRFFSWKEIKVKKTAPYIIIAKDCYASEDALRGSVEMLAETAKEHPEYMSDSGSISWNLKLDKKIAFNVGYGTSYPLREMNVFEMYWHAEGMKTLYSGTITLDGTEYEVTPEDSYGYADKNWGSGFTTPWVWLSSNHLTSRKTGKVLSNSVFDIGGGRPKIFFCALNRKLLSAFWYEGKPYEFNFSKFWTVTRTKFDCQETDTEIIWHVYQETLTAAMDTQVRCRKDDMLLIRYEAPDGSMRHKRLWNGGNGTGTVRLYEKKNGKKILIDDILAENVGCEYGEYDK